jgi:hypothetical protein
LLTFTLWFSSRKKKTSALCGITVLVYYLISLALAPLFHLHPGEYHHGSINTGYHSHTEQFATHASERSADDIEENAVRDYLGETITLFEDVAGVVQVNPVTTINPAKFSPISVLFIQSSAESCSDQLSWQDAFNWLPLHPQQDYCVLSATNLSPPQA